MFSRGTPPGLGQASQHKAGHQEAEAGEEEEGTPQIEAVMWREEGGID
jgi:hypothetical protein